MSGRKCSAQTEISPNIVKYLKERFNKETLWWLNQVAVCPSYRPTLADTTGQQNGFMVRHCPASKFNRFKRVVM